MLSHAFQKNLSSCPGFFHMPLMKDGFLCRIKLNFGNLNDKQLKIIGFCAKHYGSDCLELTTRQNIQIRGILSKNKKKIIKILSNYELNPYSITSDNVRNILISPTAGIDPFALIDPTPMAERLNSILQKNKYYHSLSPKFSILINGGEKTENCYHENDVWLSILKDQKRYILGISSESYIMDQEFSMNSCFIGIVYFKNALSAILELISFFLKFQVLHPHITRPATLKKDKKLFSLFSKMAKSQLQKKNLILDQNFCRDDICRSFARDSYFLFPQLQEKLFYFFAKPPLGRLNFKQIQNFLCLLENTRKSSNSCLIKLGHYQNFLIYNCLENEALSIISQLKKWNWGCTPFDIYTKLSCCSGQPFCKNAYRNVQEDAHFFGAYLSNENKKWIHFSGCAKNCAAHPYHDFIFTAQENKTYQIK